MLPISFSLHFSIDFQMNFDFEMYEINSWLHINGVISCLGELIHDHLRLKKHEYFSWTLNGEVTNPYIQVLHKQTFYCLFMWFVEPLEWKIRFKLFKTFLNFFLWLYDAVNFLNVLIELCWSQKLFSNYEILINLSISLFFTMF